LEALPILAADYCVYKIIWWVEAKNKIKEIEQKSKPYMIDLAPRICESLITMQDPLHELDIKDELYKDLWWLDKEPEPLYKDFYMKALTS